MTIESTDDQEPNTPAITYSECCTLPFVSLYNEDCIETMKRIPDGSIDLMLTDPPYGTTQCEWDKPINLDLLWIEWLRIIKPNGAFVFTASQPFTSELVISKKDLFKYEWVWEKNRGSGHLNAKIMPMKYHENILVFGEKITFNPIPEPYAKSSTDRYKAGEVWNPKKKISDDNIVYGKFKSESRVFLNPDGKAPNSIKYFPTVDIQNGSRTHPTQKPTDLMRYLILTYSNKGETVFDGYSGSGTTAEACMIEQRNFIGSELNKEYFDKSVQRLKNVPQSLF